MRCPANGMLMIANVVTVPLSGNSTNSSSCWPVPASTSRAGKYTLPSLPVRLPTSLPSSSARRNVLSGSEAVCWISIEVGTTSIVTGSRSSVDSVESSTDSSTSLSSKYAMSVIAPTVSSAQCTCTRAPVLMASDEPASTACSMAVSAPPSFTSAHANGRSSGWPSNGSGCHVHDTTVPTLATGTTSVRGAYVTGSYSAGGTCTRPSEPRTPTTCRLRSAVKNALSTEPTERV